MKLRAQIIIDLSANSYADAAAHQLKLEKFLASVRQTYPEAVLQLRERRERTSPGGREDAQVVPMAAGWRKG